MEKARVIEKYNSIFFIGIVRKNKLSLLYPK